MNAKLIKWTTWQNESWVGDTDSALMLWVKYKIQSTGDPLPRS